MGRLLVTRTGRATYERLTARACRGLAAAGVPAWLLTLLSVAFAAVAAWLLAEGRFLWAFLPGGASCLLDMLDGGVARASGTASGYGTLLDRTADRVVEALFLLGFLLSGRVPAWLALAGLLALFLPSYVRAVAESAARVPDAEVGLAGRLEKLALLAAGTLADAAWPEARPLAWSLAIVSLLSLVTAVQRLAHARRHAPPGRL